MTESVKFSTPIGRYRSCGALNVADIRILSDRPSEVVVSAQIRGTSPRLDDVDSWYELILQEGITTGSRVVSLRNAKLVRPSEELVFLAESVIYDARLPRYFAVED